MSAVQGRWDCERGHAAEPLPTPVDVPDPESAPPAEPVAAPAPMTAPAKTAGPTASATPPPETERVPDAARQQPPAAAPDYQRLAYQPSAPIALADLPSDFYTIQLLAMNSRSELEVYVQEAGVPGMSAAPVELNGALYYALLLGVYESRANAERALQGLPAAFADLNPWIRSLKSLQAAMTRAAALTTTPPG